MIVDDRRGRSGAGECRDTDRAIRRSDPGRPSDRTTGVTTIRPSQLRSTTRWLILAAAIIGMDGAAIYRVVTARSTLRGGGLSSGPYTALASYYIRADEALVVVVRNFATGKTTGPTVIRPPTARGLCRVWWPAFTGGFLTLLALAIASTRKGRRFVSAFPLPRMTTRRWMIAVALIGTEGGLILSTMRYAGVDPLTTPWTPILVYLVGLHALAFLPVGITMLHRFVRRQRPREDPGAAMDVP